MFNINDDIAVTSDNHTTRLKFKSNIIVPKTITVFEQHCPKYTFIQFCNSNSINVNNLTSV